MYSSKPRIKFNHILTSIALALCICGCSQDRVSRVQVDAPRPLGTQLDEILKMQELNAEASKYVMYEHEFMPPVISAEGAVSDGWKLNSYGEDHLKRVAANLNRGDHFPVVVERSRISPKQGTQYQYPIHFNEDLDLKRRAVVVAALLAMGVSDAEDRVVIAPAFAEGVTGQEASRAFSQGQSTGGGGGLRGGAGFGWGGFGGIF